MGKTIIRRDALSSNKPSNATKQTSIRLTLKNIPILNTKFNLHRSQIACISCHVKAQLIRRGFQDIKLPSGTKTKIPQFTCKHCNKNCTLSHLKEVLTSLPNTIGDNNDEDHSSIGSFISSHQDHPTNLSVSQQCNTSNVMITDWADEIPESDQQQLFTDTPPLLEPQQPDLNTPTLLERFSTQHFEHHQAMPEVLTALMKTVDQLTTRTEKQEKQITDLLTLTERLHTAQTELISAKSRIQALEAENQSLRQQHHQTTSTTLDAPTGSLESRYASLPPTTNTQQSRKPVSDQRKNLRELGIDNSRILDIHYPDTNVVGFLIHNDYATELLDLMKQHNLEPNTKFDPHNPQYLRDKKYLDMSHDEQIIQADLIQYNRILRAIDYVRQPVKFAVARFFCHTQVITPAILQDVLNGHNVAPQQSSRQPSPDRTKAAADQFRIDSPDKSEQGHDTEMIIDNGQLEDQEAQFSNSGTTHTPTPQ
ncbi:hypothetical protein BDC45DRAFT_542668 [Circinella umbellata]|nr:hypothetical protein BDC45DRAFT_542668 [Circinella umbellata]